MEAAFAAAAAGERELEVRVEVVAGPSPRHSRLIVVMMRRDLTIDLRTTLLLSFSHLQSVLQPKCTLVPRTEKALEVRDRVVARRAAE